MGLGRAANGYNRIGFVGRHDYAGQGTAASGERRAGFRLGNVTTRGWATLRMVNEELGIAGGRDYVGVGRAASAGGRAGPGLSS